MGSKVLTNVISANQNKDEANSYLHGINMCSLHRSRLLFSFDHYQYRLLILAYAHQNVKVDHK